MPIGLIIVALATVFVFPGYDRGQFYRNTEHDDISADHLAIAANLSSKHGFAQFLRRRFNADGELTYEAYHRFPLLGDVLIKLVGLPVGDGLSARLYAGRVLVLAFFAAAMVLAYLSLRLLTSGAAVRGRWPGSAGTALAATLLAFSSYPLIYYSDAVTPEAAMGLFSVLLAFHGVAVYLQGGRRPVQRTRIGQLCVKTGAALLLDWHVYGLLLPLLLVALPQAIYARDWRRCRDWVLLGAVAVVTGLAMLLFNLGREHHLLGGTTPFAELPSLESMLRRSGVTALDGTGWAAAIQEQLRRIGEAALPWALAAPLEGWLHGRWHRVGGGCLALAALLICLPGTRHRAAWSGLALCGMGWALPMRDQVEQHEFEAMFHVGAPLVAVALALTRLQGLAVARRGAARLLQAGLGAAVAVAFGLFVASSWLLSRMAEDPATRQWERMVLADVEEIRRHTRGKVVYVPRAVLEWNPCCPQVYLTGSVMVFQPSPAPGLAPDLVLATNIPRSEREGPAPNSPASRSLTPGNRVLFLYEWNVYRNELAAARGVYERLADEGDPPAIQSHWNVHYLDDALLYVGEGDLCQKQDEPKFFLHVYPVDWHDLPERSRREGFAQLSVRRDRNWTRNGRCFVAAFLPRFPIGAIHTGQVAWRGGNPIVWEGRLYPRELWLHGPDELAALRREYQRTAAGEPVVYAAWNIHLQPRADGGREVAYLKTPCGKDDAAARFFAHVVPVDAGVLPVSRRRLAFDNWDFHFRERGGVLFDGKCVVRLRLPDYETAKVRTGQYDATAGELWRTEFPVPPATR